MTEPRRLNPGTTAGIALICLTPVLFFAGGIAWTFYAGVVLCAHNAPDVPCTSGPGWGFNVAVFVPAVLGILSLATSRKWPLAPLTCWVMAVTLVVALILLR